MADVDERTANRNYQKPAAGNKLKFDVDRIRAALEAIDADVAALLLALTAKAALGHGHTMQEVEGLLAALDDKAAADHLHALGDLFDVSLAGAANNQFLAKQGNQWIPAFVAIANISGLAEQLGGKLSAEALPSVLAALAAKAPPVDADSVTLIDSTDSSLKRLSLSNLKTWIKSWLASGSEYTIVVSTSAPSGTPAPKTIYLQVDP